jgi:hypothetical protein
LPYFWFDTPNVRFLSITDFGEFCSDKGIRIIETHYLGKKLEIRLLPNLFALNAIFVLSKPQ